MINRAALGILAGLTFRTLMDFYIRYKEVDEFGRMPYAKAVELVSSEKGTVAQRERLTALAIANVHALHDAQRLSMQTLDPRNPEDMDRIRAYLNGGMEEPAAAGYL